MNTSQARRIIWQTKKNIGALRLRLGSDAQTDARSQLGANLAQLRDLWKRYPECPRESPADAIRPLKGDHLYEISRQ
jgi:hypothetical protein